LSKVISWVLVGCMILLATVLYTTLKGVVNVETWDLTIGLFSSMASWIVIIFLLIERHDKERPYLQVAFEPIRSTLACLTIRNTGLTPAVLKSLVINDEFALELTKDVQERLLKYKETENTIFPGKAWVISLDVNVFDIINEFMHTSISVDFSYSRLNRKKLYQETIKYDFEDYSGFLVYTSEMDELKKSTDTLTKSIVSVTRSIEKVSVFKDDWERYIACGGYEKSKDEILE